jgi:hypothetical protein
MMSVDSWARPNERYLFDREIAYLPTGCRAPTVPCVATGRKGQKQACGLELAVLLDRDS